MLICWSLESQANSFRCCVLWTFELRSDASNSRSETRKNSANCESAGSKWHRRGFCCEHCKIRTIFGAQRIAQINVVCIPTVSNVLQLGIAVFRICNPCVNYKETGIVIWLRRLLFVVQLTQVCYSSCFGRSSWWQWILVQTWNRTGNKELANRHTLFKLLFWKHFSLQRFWLNLCLNTNNTISKFNTRQRLS